MKPLALWSHSPLGLITFCLPVGLSVLAAWEFLARDPVRDLLGLPVTSGGKAHAPRWWARAILALVVGAATHLVWDGLTHRGGWGLRVMPMLGSVVLALDSRPLIRAGVLDYASTLVGGVVVLAWLGKELRDAHAFEAFARSRWRWLVTLSVGATSLAVGLWNGFSEATAMNYWDAELKVAPSA